MSKKTYFIAITTVVEDYYEIELTNQELKDLQDTEDRFEAHNWVQENAKRQTGETQITEIKIEKMYE